MPSPKYRQDRQITGLESPGSYCDGYFADNKIEINMFHYHTTPGPHDGHYLFFIQKYKKGL